MTETVWLQRPGADVPWGFRLHGGRDYQTPLAVQKVTSGSIAATGLGQGDVILRIGETETSALTYAQAMDVIKNSGNLLQLSISKRGGQGAYSPQVDAANNMSSTGVHDLFQDMYRYTDPYAQEGAHTHTQPAPAPTPSYPYQQPSYSTGGGSANDHSSFDQYGRQPQHNSNSYPHSQQPYSNIGAGAAPAPSSHAPPAQAPPTYSDVQIHRDQVAYPYQPTHTPTTPNYPYQPSTAPASQSYQYPHSMSSSTSELSDVSSGFGASDGKPSGTSPAMGHPMTSPPTGGMARPYTSGGSSVDSSSGVGSYNCEPPEHADTTYTPHPVGRQDSLPAPPPSLHEASVIDYNHSEQQCFNAEDTPNPSTPITDPVTAPPPAPAPPPPPPPPPPLPQSCPPKSWKAQQAESSSYQPAQPTRLEQQLANMSMEPEYGRQNSYPYQSTTPQSPSHPPGAPAPPATAPYYGGSRTPTSPAAPPATRPQPAMPDAVLNMAARGGSDKKPFTYAPDMESIKEQRDKVRRSLKKDQGQDVTQSPVYRMIHGLDSDRSKPRPVNTQMSSEGHRGPRGPSKDDELCFTGVLDRSDIPSKSFHRLQNMTGGADIDTTSIRHNVSGDAPEEDIVGAYDQASIRYTGRNIPSKSFRMLQTMTGDDGSMGSELTVPGQQKRQRRHRPEPQPASPEQNPDDIVDISYVGANIPSRSFKMLQHSVGGDDTTTEPDEYDEDGGAAFDDMYYLGENIPSRSFQLLQSAVGNDPHAVAVERRLRRRNRITSRQNSMAEDEMIAKQCDKTFDEDAYLSGQVDLSVAADDAPKPKRAARSSSREVAPWQADVDKETADNTVLNQDFDEDSYLSGRISILGNEPKRPPRPIISEMIPKSQPDDPESSENQTTFDEDAYLCGRINIMSGERTAHPGSHETSKPCPVEINDAPEITQPFDEDSYLSGKLNMLGGEPQARPEKVIPEEDPEWMKKRQAQLSRRKKHVPQTNGFDEDRFLGVQNKEAALPVEDPTPSEPFDENAYLAGQVIFLGGNPAAPKTEPRPPGEPSASWQKPDMNEENSIKTDASFDEDAYLSGKVPILRDSVEKELPPRGDKPNKYRPRASWERPDVDDDAESTESEGQFDENKYLAGRSNPYVRNSMERDATQSPVVNGGGQFSNIPSRTFHYLRRSMSREESPSEFDRQRHNSFDPVEEDLDTNKAYDEMVYVGNKIPSKTFQRLERCMSRKPQTKQDDPIEHLKEKITDGIDVDVMDNLKIDHHDPDQYLEQLKKTVQENNNIKIEAIPDEVTDF